MAAITDSPTTPLAPGVAAAAPTAQDDEPPAHPRRRSSTPWRRDPQARRHETLTPLAAHFRAYLESRGQMAGKPDIPPSPPVYICPMCKDAGFVYPRDERGRVVYSRVIPCPGRGCTQDQSEQLRLQEISAGPSGTRRPEQSFDSFEPVRGTTDALRHARSLAAGKGAFIWLLIYGGTGNGKTHLCNAMAREIIRRGIDSRLVAVADLFSALRSAISSGDSDITLQRFKDAQFLLLDDYGVQLGSEWEAARFDELMTYRYANLMPTAMTTNLDITDLPERLQSRFEDRMLSRIAHNAAPDFRVRRPANIRKKG